ncbi:MAG TPA: GrpB family protein, partial [Phycisphaerae bacterium]|nr:GrpB family protein [Phycisphaerae bacterium]
MIGLSRDTVQVVPYQSCWAQLFLQEADRLRLALGSVIGRIEHIGSTSVPGMNAKPIIDMLAAVEKLSSAGIVIPALERLGYEHCRDNPVPGRLFFVLGPQTGRTHYLSLAEAGSAFWCDHMAFRDYLLTHPAAANDYLVLKQRLAARFAHDRASYTAAKNDFITNVLSSPDCNAWPRS